jgi:putative transposase
LRAAQEFLTNFGIRHGQVVRTPFRAPQAGVAERFVRTARSECFDRLLILNQQHLQRIFAAFIAHYNGHRAHRALSLMPPEPRRPLATMSPPHDAPILRRDRLGGVVHEYELAAA